MTEIILNRFLIDIVESKEENKVRIVTYLVLAPNGDEALRRFFDEEAGTVVFEGEVVDKVVIGMTVDDAGVYDQ